MAQIVVGKSDSGLHIALHPLVLLTISDYVTRHTLRRMTSPVVGALLGQQNGRETTIEHAFECKASLEDGGSLDMGWFEERLQQMKDVHKEPVLDLVGWYTTMPASGPQQYHIPIQTQLSDFYPECTLLLGFHPSAVLEGTVGGKLPLSVYETNAEHLKTGGQDANMMTDSPDLKVTYKEVPYTIETGEAEMISVDFVARGGGNATAVPTAAATKEDSSAANAKEKGKGKAVDKQQKLTAPIDEQSALTREDEELIASLTAKANAIKMLRSRISLITIYLEQLPPTYVKGEAFDDAAATAAGHTPVDYNIVRSIQALLNRLALLIPSNTTAFNEELLAEQNDVNIVNLLNTLTESMKGTREVGRKFQVVQSGKQANKKGNGGFNGGEGFLPPLEGFRPNSAGDLML